MKSIITRKAISKNIPIMILSVIGIACGSMNSNWNPSLSNSEAWEVVKEHLDKRNYQIHVYAFNMEREVQLGWILHVHGDTLWSDMWYDMPDYRRITQTFQRDTLSSHPHPIIDYKQAELSRNRKEVTFSIMARNPKTGEIEPVPHRLVFLGGNTVTVKAGKVSGTGILNDSRFYRYKSSTDGNDTIVQRWIESRKYNLYVRDVNGRKSWQFRIDADSLFILRMFDAKSGPTEEEYFKIVNYEEKVLLANERTEITFKAVSPKDENNGTMTVHFTVDYTIGYVSVNLNGHEYTGILGDERLEMYRYFKEKWGLP